MPSVRGCNLPDDLLYDVDNHIWFKEEGDGNVKIGMTAVATAMSGKLVAFTPKRVGRAVRAGKSAGTLESGKIADMVILDKNPLKSARNYRSIYRVIKDGEVIDIDALPLNPVVSHLKPHGQQ